MDSAGVKRIAHLARMEIPEDELPLLAGELSQVLVFIDRIREAGQAGDAAVDPAIPVLPGRDGDESWRWRPDSVTVGDIRQDVLSGAPESRDGFFLCPRVIE